MGPDRIATPRRIVFFGTYDRHRPRFRVLSCGLQRAGVEITECHASIWGGLEDRSHLRSTRHYVGPGLRWCLAVQALVQRYLHLPLHDAVIVSYLGQADALVAKRLARRRGVPLIFDPYVSLHETIIGDRRLARTRSLTARAVRLLDVGAFRAADALVVDTRAHGDLMARGLDIPTPRSFVVPVGAESDVFVPAPLHPRASRATVLFYGSMIPLHGVDTIVRAAALLRRDPSIRFRLIGTGQEYAKVRALASTLRADSLIDWVERVPYEQLPGEIARADVCLGIFGTSDKAQAVVPNKVYQALAVGRPIINADTPAMREWFTSGLNCVLVPPGNHEALAAAIIEVLEDRALQEGLAEEGHRLFSRAFTPEAIGLAARAAIEALVCADAPPPRCPTGEALGTERRSCGVQ